SPYDSCRAERADGTRPAGPRWPRRRIVHLTRFAGMRSGSWFRLSLRLAARGVRSPSTAAALLGVAWRFRRRGWLTRFPFLPIPDREYVRWRMLTAYGDSSAIPPADDVVRYARWAARD